MTEEDDCQSEEQSTGRTIHIDTGFYEVKVWGDPEDELEDVRKAAKDCATEARKDVEELSNKMDNGGGKHYG